MKSYNLIYFPEISSTNDHALKNINDFSDRDILMAEIQTAGKGQFERKWISDKPDNIYISIVLKPEIKKENMTLLQDFSLYLAVKTCKTLEKYITSPAIKPPNDILINGKKIAGILAQCSTRGDKLNGLILGLGVNLNLEKSDLKKIDQPATALNIETNSIIQRDIFLENLLTSFFSDYDEFITQGFMLVEKEYNKRKTPR
jgi:BirA family biotin operon repressor/biotin-[acetyl-CoA-carboxylase] ligase